MTVCTEQKLQNTFPFFTIQIYWTQNECDWLLFLPNSKHPVKQESAKEAQNNVGPRIPGVQLHELGCVQVHILVQSQRKRIRSLSDTDNCFALFFIQA